MSCNLSSKPFPWKESEVDRHAFRSFRHTRRRAGVARPGNARICPFPGRGGNVYVQEIASGGTGRQGSTVEVWTADFRGRGGIARSGGRQHRHRKGIADDSAQSFPVVRLASNGRLTPGGLLRLGVGVLPQTRADKWQGPPGDFAERGRADGVLSCLAIVSGLASRARQVTMLFPWLRSAPFSGETLSGVSWRKALLYAGVRVWQCRLRSTWNICCPCERIAAARDQRLSSRHVRCPAVFEETERGGISRPGGRMMARARVLTVARLHPRKGQVEVAHARWPCCPPRNANGVVYQLVGVGEASYQREIEDVCRAGGRVLRMAGRARRRRKLGVRLRLRATIYVQASRTLSAKRGGIRDFVPGGLVPWLSGGGVPFRRSGRSRASTAKRACLSPRSDLPAGLAAAVGRLLGRPDALRAQLGEAGRAFARRVSVGSNRRGPCVGRRRSDGNEAWPGLASLHPSGLPACFTVIQLVIPRVDFPIDDRNPRR